jgi:hypothetical protein
VALAGSLRTTGVLCLPAALLALRPSVAPSALHPARRAWRLSYALAALFVDLPKGRAVVSSAAVADEANEAQVEASTEKAGEDCGDFGSACNDDAGEAGGGALAPLSRQALLEERSAAGRLRLLLREIVAERKMMAAAKMMETISRERRENGGRSEGGLKGGRSPRK